MSFFLFDFFLFGNIIFYSQCLFYSTDLDFSFLTLSRISIFDIICFHFTFLISNNLWFQNKTWCKLLEPFMSQVSSSVSLTNWITSLVSAFLGQHSYNDIRLNQIKSYFTFLTFNVLISVHVQQHASLKQRLLMKTKGLSTTERST